MFVREDVEQKLSERALLRRYCLLTRVVRINEVVHVRIARKF